MGSSTPLFYGITSGPDGALWFTDLNNPYVGRITTAGAVTQFAVPNSLSTLAIHTASDGNLWFTAQRTATTYAFATISTAGAIAFRSTFSDTTTGRDFIDFAQGADGALWYQFQNGGQNIGRLTLGGSATTLAYTQSGTHAFFGVTSAPDGALYFTDSQVPDLVRVTTGGTISTIPLPVKTQFPTLQGITVGGDGALWIGEITTLGRYTTAGAYGEATIPAAPGGVQASPFAVCTGRDGAVYFTAGSASVIGRVSLAGVVTLYQIPTPLTESVACTLGPDGAIWFTETTGKIGRLG